jgi:hypothetical protein
MPSRKPLSQTIPTISHVCEDGRLIEALFDAKSSSTQLAQRDAAGQVTITPFVDLPSGERLAPYSAKNNLIASRCVLLSSDVQSGWTKTELLAQVQTYIHRYVDLPASYEAIAAHFVLLTWVYDAFRELPYLRFRGDYGSGKTRALQVIGSVCYKPFFASGASTVSPIFHVLDAFQGTLVLDEADFRFSDATAELTKILNNGNAQGLPVLRTMTNRHRELNPRAFRVFGPKLLAMRQGFSDRALESRFLTVEMGGRSLRADVPIHSPASLDVEATALRNHLLAFRFENLAKVGPKPERAVAGVEPRLNQMALALLSMIDDDALRQALGDELAGEEARVMQERASTLEAAMLVALVESFETAPMAGAPISDVGVRFNRKASAELGREASNKWVGGFLRNRLRLTTAKSHGVFIVPRSDWAKVQVLAKKFGLGRDRLIEEVAPARLD